MIRNTIFILALLFSITTFGQCLSVINGSKSHPFPPDKYDTYLYLDGVVDMGTLLTRNEGLDYDVEIGHRSGNTAVYGYFGEFRRNNYKNFGVGVDYFAHNTRTLDISVGAQLGAIRRWDGVNHLAYALRIKPVLALTDEIGLVSRIQYQQRPDKRYHGMFEVAMGIQFKIY